ncbi:MAG: MarR family winged helix-turn-helix transcriptional regulator [Pirellulaceae bacterium]
MTTRRSATSSSQRAAQYSEAVSQCACFRFRKASRAITQLFDEALQPVGLRSTQLVILLSIGASEEPPTIAQLAREMVMDPSTLNRNLQPLSRRRLVSRTTSRDGRRKFLSLTDKGVAAIEESVPLWEKAQTQFVEQIGSERWGDLRQRMDAVISAARLS